MQGRVWGVTESEFWIVYKAEYWRGFKNASLESYLLDSYLRDFSD